MADETRALILDMVEWIAAKPRSYAEVMDAWRTHCPRLTVWEDAVDAGLVVCERGETGTRVSVTARGRDLLESESRLPAPAEAL